jgi:hypothetical protein
MKKLQKLIKTKKDCEDFIDLLINQAKENKPISNNPMIDGMIICFFLCNRLFIIDFFTVGLKGRLLDSTKQQLEQSFIWLINNENKLCELIKQK